MSAFDMKSKVSEVPAVYI